MPGPRTTPPPKVALVLSGGGARAAWQVGVLQAVAGRFPPDAPLPFAIVCGTSAGAINAAALASGAARFAGALERLQATWTGLHPGDVFRTDPWSLARRAQGLLGSLAGRRRPASLLDNAPLAELLRRTVRFDAIDAALAAGTLEALAVSAHSWRSGRSVTFFQARGLEGWSRAQRVGVPVRIGVEHLLASCAIPLIFPPAEVDGEWYGDGAVRQVAPVSSALHLGADRILVVGAQGARHAGGPPGAPPSTAEIGGQVLSGMFTDALGTDLERIRLVNEAVRQIDPAALPRSPVPLRDVGLLAVSPGASLEEVALRHLDALPRSVRLLLRGLGVGRRGGGGLLSYLLFEPGYCGDLLALGRADGARRASEIAAFLDGAA